MLLDDDAGFPPPPCSPLFVQLLCRIFSDPYVSFFLSTVSDVFLFLSVGFILFLSFCRLSLLFVAVSSHLSVSRRTEKKNTHTQAFMRLDENLTRFNSLFVGDGPNRLFVYFQPADQANEASTPLFVKCSYPFIFWSSEHVQHE